MPQLRLGGSTVGTQARDVWQPTPGRDYAEVGELAWIDAQLAALHIGDFRRELVEATAAIERADAWFSRNDHTSRHWTEACRRLATWERTAVRFRNLIELTAWRCWVSCCDTFVCLQYVPEAREWLQSQGVSFGSPEEIWAHLMGERPTPCAWPWPNDTHEHWVEMRPKQAEVWNLVWMRELLSERKAA